jgi:diphosphomevalonate decarboxylase
MQSHKATAQAHSNIALVKYWGKGDETLRLPVNSSLALALDAIYTVTTVEFDETLSEDIVEIDNDTFSQKETAKVSAHVDLLRQRANVNWKAKVKTKNNFPKAVGAASSASGFAALTVAAAAALDLQLTEKELSIISRQGSGSASRSIPGGVSHWHRGSDSDSSFAEKIEYPAEWDLKVLLVFVGDLAAKKIGSTEGMALAHTSPYFTQAVAEAEKNIDRIKTAFSTNNWRLFGQVIEDECFRLHMLCMTTTPNILYWQGTTVDIFQTLLTLREQHIDGFFTVDAGPHVHVVCRATDVATIKEKLEKIQGVTSVVECGIGKGAHTISTHLF